MSTSSVTPKGSPALSPTVTPAELGSFLDAVAPAPVALRDVPRINSILARLVGLANSKHPVGEVIRDEPSPADRSVDLAAAGLPTATVLPNGG